MKILSRFRPSAEPIPGETQTHWQDNPLISVVFKVKRMDENVQKAYYDNDEQLNFKLQLEKQFKVKKDQIQRANYRDQCEQNFTHCYFLEFRQPNETQQNEYRQTISNHIAQKAAENKQKRQAEPISEEEFATPEFIGPETIKEIEDVFFNTQTTPPLISKVVNGYIERLPVD